MKIQKADGLGDVVGKAMDKLAIWPFKTPQAAPVPAGAILDEPQDDLFEWSPQRKQYEQQKKQQEQQRHELRKQRQNEGAQIEQARQQKKNFVGNRWANPERSQG